ncbi:hypothetical protein KIH39_08200 [Telmatocola sphagniphila]|uniref:Cytochrome C Planctomycete-type domain-containing protein n=1 Tax=Telmatocola sphagniphila TaxID=1123043 RepID=A0A8E6EUM5_9BACT|nr:c-type cytochrome domain-containing protein [Telmatocola sphagniphila]QVL33874.1 hypothetical protein KIH39_08200 [Telmatocola sphagniphila]
MKVPLIFWGLLASLALASPSQADEKTDLAAQAYEVIAKHCLRCHKGPGSEGGVANFGSLADLQAPRGKKAALIVAGKPEESRLYQRLAIDGDMPPEEALRATGKPTEEEKAILKKWIEASAPPFTNSAKQRNFITLADELTAIREALQKANREDRPYIRFFTLTHLHNDKTIPEAKLKLIRAALSKAINSLSLKPTIVLPESVNSAGTVYAVDIRRLDWDTRHLWNRILEFYPYGLLYTKYPDPNIRRLAEDVEDLSKAQIPALRADWFVATALRPPLYHTLLNIPEDARVLEQRVGVNVATNFESDKLARAGFSRSGVSAQNRLVERHDSNQGVYWKSYDFKPDAGRGRLIRFPLGPLNLFSKGHHPYENQAFVHDGGEIIFSLPNKLHAYMLVDGKNKRIDEGPISVVGDSKKTAGTSAIVNGISCMACHTKGMIELKDYVRDNSAVFGKADDKVRKLYPDAKKMDELIQQDQEQYLSALEKAVGPFLKIGPDANKSIADLSEPCSYVIMTYRSSSDAYLTLDRIACELYLKNGEELKAKVGAKKFKELGLASLLSQPDAVIARLEWEAVDGYSLMQELGKELGCLPIGK